MRSRLRRVTGLAADSVDPFRLVARLPLRPSPVTLLSVYRRRNAGNVAALLADTGWPSRLWALDEADPALPTVGVGAGSRFALLNRLAADVPSDHMLLVADDDVTFRPGHLRAFAGLAAYYEFDLAMPAHDRRASYYFHRITRRHPFRVARQTTFVEIGPVLAVSPQARYAVTPFPEDGMGWGTELSWSAQRLYMGIVDATPVRHLTAPATGYDRSGEDARQEAMFAAFGVSGWLDVQRNVRSLYVDLRLRPQRERAGHVAVR